jgi:hypothetical protein
MQISIQKSTRAGKKYMAEVNNKTIHFGATGYEDFTTSKDEKRKASYLARHKTSEDWTLSGIDSAGFWARWLLWNRPSITASIRDINQRFTSLSVSLR